MVRSTRREFLFVLSVFLVLVQAAAMQARPEPPGRRVLIGFEADAGPRTPNERAAMVRQGGGAACGAFHLVPVVAAMSLRGESTTSLASACDRAYVRGVLLVAAGGNDGGAVARVWASGLTSNTAVRDRLAATAEDLGTPGFDDYFGYGLVDAQRAAGTGAAGDDTEEVAKIRIADPQEGARVSGSIVVTVAVSRDTGVDRVDFFIDGASIGVDADGSDGWSVTWDTTSFVDGEHTITAVATDAAGRMASHLGNVMVNNAAVPVPTVVSVRSITYSTKGGRLGDLHLLITLRVEDDLGHPVANASVVAFVSRNGSVYQAIVDRTNSGGSARLRIVKAAPGSYETRVADVTAEGLNWDGVTPVNEFLK